MIIIQEYEEKCYCCCHNVSNICFITKKIKDDNDDCDCDNFLMDLDISSQDQVDTGFTRKLFK